MKENLDSSITIHDFEPFEINWLLRYIYGLRKFYSKEAGSARRGSESGHTCTLLILFHFV